MFSQIRECLISLGNSKCFNVLRIVQVLQSVEIKIFGLAVVHIDKEEVNFDFVDCFSFVEK